MATQSHHKFIKYYPQHMILLSLLGTMLIGVAFLALPISRLKEISFIDLLFTSASLTTVTGLTTVPLDAFSDTGHFIMLLLIQLGGLGLMTLSLVFIYMFTNLGVYTQVVASEVLSIRNLKDTKKILFFMFKFTMLIEFIGACVIFPTMYQTYSLKYAIFLSIFHSISSFCNAGVTLFPNGIMTYENNPIFIITTTLLMIVGGLGFVTWHELILRFRSKEHLHHFSWHTKLVLKMYGATSLATGILFWILERHNALAHIPIFKKLYFVFFTAISMKSTGFLIFPVQMLYLTTLLVCMVSMFIGSAPLSTGSGIKTSVFAIYLAIIKAAILGKRHAVLFGRHIIDEQVYKATAIIALSLSWILVAIFSLLFIEPNSSFIDVLFETVSAFTNNGTATNLSASVSTLGKLLIMSTMLIGRIGALAVVMSMKRSLDLHEISFPKERIILG
ncbi:hypothetical protein HYV11_01830 [Candidatus Dependentiae bacterium]|nr:hypothetical protein [Candidatus Dependentiae bacterium]